MLPSYTPLWLDANMFVQATPDISTQVMETQQIAANRKRSAPSSATRSSTKKAKQFKAAVRDVKKKQTDDEGESVPISIGNLPLLRPSPAKEIGQSEPAAAATIAEPSLEDGEEMSLVKPVESQEPDQTTARGLLEYYCRSNGLPTPHFEGIRKAESQGEKEYCSLAAHTEEIAAQEDAAKVATRLMGLYVDVYDRTFPEKTSPEATRTMLRDALQWWEQSVPILEPQLGPWLASVPPEKWPYPDVDLQAHVSPQAYSSPYGEPHNQSFLDRRGNGGRKGWRISWPLSATTPQHQTPTAGNRPLRPLRPSS
ncbi:hypothetical protein LTR60_000097 [Cryomyces antarcticus]|nr:hypothetical protein LTR39_000023 [Cryomyces antarcticus]KAK5021160.1 hypothetical protein LTR60_000097 [Cryomyces antarcticus]